MDIHSIMSKPDDVNRREITTPHSYIVQRLSSPVPMMKLIRQQNGSERIVSLPISLEDIMFSFRMYGSQTSSRNSNRQIKPPPISKDILEKGNNKLQNDQIITQDVRIKDPSWILKRLESIPQLHPEKMNGLMPLRGQEHQIFRHEHACELEIHQTLKAALEILDQQSEERYF